MKIVVSKRRGLPLISVLLAVATTRMLAPVQAEDGKAERVKLAAPSTTAAPDIPLDHLRLLVKPLTKEELIVEADGWRDLVKAKIQQIARQQIAVKEQTAVFERAAESATRTPKRGPSAAKPEPAADAEAAAQHKQELVATLPELNEDQANLVDRLNVVVDALAKKGGGVESYRQYIAAVTGLDLAASDSKTIWTILRGWLASERGGQRWLWNVGKFLLILIVFYFAARMVANLVRQAAARVKGASQLLVNFLGSFVKQVMMMIGLIVGLAALEVNVGPLLAAVGAAGFVVAFALQDTLSNFASGMLILAYRPFDVGDVIEAAGVSGIVDSVSLFSTHIRTFDNKFIIVPNNDIWRGSITNATASATRRVDMVFGIGYGDDIGKAKTILQRLVTEHELVLADPAAVVQLHELADSSIKFIVRPWTKTSDYWTVYWDITRAVKEEFDRNGISIPFPQRDIHVYHRDAAGNGKRTVTAQDG